MEPVYSETAQYAHEEGELTELFPEECQTAENDRESGAAQVDNVPEEPHQTAPTSSSAQEAAEVVPSDGTSFGPKAGSGAQILRTDLSNNEPLFGLFHGPLSPDDNWHPVSEYLPIFGGCIQLWAQQFNGQNPKSFLVNKGGAWFFLSSEVLAKTWNASAAPFCFVWFSNTLSPPPFAICSIDWTLNRPATEKETKAVKGLVRAGPDPTVFWLAVNRSSLSNTPIQWSLTVSIENDRVVVPLPIAPQDVLKRETPPKTPSHSSIKPDIVESITLSIAQDQAMLASKTTSGEGEVILLGTESQTSASAIVVDTVNVPSASSVVVLQTELLSILVNPYVCKTGRFKDALAEPGYLRALDKMLPDKVESCTGALCEILLHDGRIRTVAIRVDGFEMPRKRTPVGYVRKVFKSQFMIGVKYAGVLLLSIDSMDGIEAHKISIPSKRMPKKRSVQVDVGFPLLLNPQADQQEFQAHTTDNMEWTSTALSTAPFEIPHYPELDLSIPEDDGDDDTTMDSQRNKRKRSSEDEACDALMSAPIPPVESGAIVPLAHHLLKMSPVLCPPNHRLLLDLSLPSDSPLLGKQLPTIPDSNHCHVHVRCGADPILCLTLPLDKFGLSVLDWEPLLFSEGKLCTIVFPTGLQLQKLLVKQNSSLPQASSPLELLLAIILPDNVSIPVQGFLTASAPFKFAVSDDKPDTRG